ncbi:hypothetical protein [Streptomyces filamentosus]|uniref:hypothetical protein n=1 Tax=Streptomyces filamentosus TaxID=67294 RepID=UPI0033CFB834
MSQHPVPTDQPSWTPFDEYLWHTCEIVADVVQGQLDRRPLVANVAPLPAGDRALATGPARSFKWTASGDGSCQHTQIGAAGSPMLVIGSLLGSTIDDSSRRAAAARDAQPVDRGGFLRGDGQPDGRLIIRPVEPAGSVLLYWSGLRSIGLVAPDVFQTHLVTADGAQVTMRIATPWASLMFVLAALTRFPAHPRLLERGWLPPGFEQRSAAVGRPCRRPPTSSSAEEEPETASSVGTVCR